VRIRETIRRTGAAFGQGYRSAVTTGRWAVVAGWVLIVTALVSLVPPHGGGGGFGEFLPPDHPILQTQRRVLQEFRVPVLSGTTVVVHQPGGLSLLTRADSYLWALATTQDNLEGRTPPGPDQIIAAVPVPTGRADVTVTYLYGSEGTGTLGMVRLGDQYAAHFQNQPGVQTYVTGFVPAQIAQGGYLNARLGLFELASLILILLVVALAFRSLLAPLVVVGIAAVGYLVYLPMLTLVADAAGFEVPGQLEPVLLALLLGVVTDYCVLFFHTFRDELDTGVDNRSAARNAVRRNASVIAVAGLTVAGGTIALLAAPFEIFRALGPALALTVLIGVVLSLTLTPAAMTILGWRLFTVVPVRGSHRAQPTDDEESVPAKLERREGRLVRKLVQRGPALLATALVVVVLGLAALPLTQARFDLSFTAGLPDQDPVAEGAQLLQEVGLRGISAPTEVLVEQEGITQQRAALIRMEQALARQPGVARVLGPDDSPFTDPRGIVLSEDGNAARYVVIFDSDPLAAQAIDHVRALQSTAPGLARSSGLADAQVTITGQTVIAAEVAHLTRLSLEIVLVAALVIELIILALYLRALVAPVVLLACSALSVAAALGLTTLLFQGILGEQGLTFYAPFAAAVLLIALGSDYNVFSVGSIWHEAKRRPLAEALSIAVPRSSQAITIAGLILAATFALVAIIPLSTFRQIAFAMTVGLLLDTLVIRPILTPAVLTLLGRHAGWPSKRIRTALPATETAPGPAPATAESTPPAAAEARR
jgi:putative drug exporter of the RND superfamily